MIKQFVPQEACLRCQGCCRFLQAATIWAPCLLKEEVKLLSEGKQVSGLISQENRLRLEYSKKKGIFFCPFLSEESNKCEIYAMRPFECQLYPFVLKKEGEKKFLAVDLNCVYAKDNFASGAFKEYAGYLSALLNNTPYRGILKDNPQIIQEYTEALKLVELEI